MTFTLVKENVAQICIDSHAADYKGLKHVAKILAGDILTVTGKEPEDCRADSECSADCRSDKRNFRYSCKVGRRKEN